MSTPTATSQAPSSASQAASAVHRVEVRPTAIAGDPRGEAVVQRLTQRGCAPTLVQTAKVYLIEGPLSAIELDRVCAGLLADPVVEEAAVAASPAPANSTLLEVHPLPGVMDPAAQSVADAIHAMTGIRVRVSTGLRYELQGVSESETETIAARVLANPVVHGVHRTPFAPDALPAGTPREPELRHVAVRDLDDAALEKLSREAHLFLSLDEMRTIQAEYSRLGREPTEIELETLAQTWSEHCVHKTLKSTIHYHGPEGDTLDFANRPGHELHEDGSVTIHNLLKSTVAAATFELIDDGVDWTRSVFVDNAGIIAFDDDHAVCVKVETHNRPSAIEPYGGAATGIGGCIRDIIGTGLAAKPIASTDVFCVAPPEIESVPSGCLHPRRILSEVVGGVRDYGNRMGIPTVNGAVWFDQRYVGNPLVYCGCIGIMPADLIAGDPAPGDRIIALGGRTGRDGIHGATFSSSELTDTHADEFSHAVQIGNAIEEKRVLDAILRARDARPASEGGPLFRSITDCGAGGFSSAIGEMGEKLGAEVHLDRAPLKYDGLTSTEIWISEAQERMVLAVPEANVAALQQICDEEHVELADLGHFGTDGAELILIDRGLEVGRLPMGFVHDGLPMPTRTATWTTIQAEASEPEASAAVSADQALLQLLAHPNIASKHWIIRQYDHEVQGNTVTKPLVGPDSRGPSDASVIEPVPGSGRGLAIGCGLATGLEDDPYQMTLAAIDECVRNLVCSGADPERIAILDNFCWPSCNKPENLGSLVRAAEGCYDGAMAYRTPFVSGKDSLNNQFVTEDGTTIEIPPTLLISGIGIVPDVRTPITMDAKQPGNLLLEVGPIATTLRGSHYARSFGATETEAVQVDLLEGPLVARVVAELIAAGKIHAAHDVSDGGLACAIAEMLIAGSTEANPIGAALTEGVGGVTQLFGEGPSRYVLEVAPSQLEAVETALANVHFRVAATLNDSGTLTLDETSTAVAALADAWLGTLDW